METTFCLILIQPRSSGNIGAVARAMMNMGVSELRLVDPLSDPINKEALDRAVDAKHILKEAKFFKTLKEAVADCHQIVGTCGKERKSKLNRVSPREFAQSCLVKGKEKIALVFGTEDRGLSHQELLYCDLIVEIPASEENHSLNLSHAVIIILYELLITSTTILDNKLKDHKTLVPSKIKEDFYDHLKEALLSINFLDPKNPDRMMKELRSIYSKVELDQREVDILRGICRQILNR